MQNAWDLLMPMFGAFMGLTILIGIALYIYMSIALMTIANKTKTPNAWLAWIPIVNFFLMAQIGKVPWWTALIAILSGIVPAIGGLIFLAMWIWWWWKIAEARKKPGWFSILTILPIVNLIIIGVIAWAD